MGSWPVSLWELRAEILLLDDFSFHRSVATQILSSMVSRGSFLCSLTRSQGGLILRCGSWSSFRHFVTNLHIFKNFMVMSQPNFGFISLARFLCVLSLCWRQSIILCCLSSWKQLSFLLLVCLHYVLHKNTVQLCEEPVAFLLACSRLHLSVMYFSSQFI